MPQHDPLPRRKVPFDWLRMVLRGGGGTIRIGHPGIRSSHTRKPPEAGIAVPADPPRGPLPKQGGAEAPLDFGD